MKKININSLVYIKYMLGLYQLIDAQTNLVIDSAFDLEQLVENLIRHYNNYLSNNDEIELIDLIKSVRELKSEVSKLKVIKT